MDLLITGDFYISDDYRGKSLFDSSVIDLFNRADYRIVNLEAPITAKNKLNKILKTGPHLHSTKETVIPSLIRLKIDLVTLANNHIMDYGGSGLEDTLTCLKSSKIDAIGAGLNLWDAMNPLFLKKDDFRIAILNFAENEWASASNDKPGASPIDLIENVKKIREAKNKSEFVIVIVHGGHEYFNFPSPEIVKRYRFYAENGASVIVGHHPHCINGYEEYRGTPIFYSLGNFIFTESSEFDAWYQGMVLNLKIQKDKNILWELIPISQSKVDYTVTLIEGKEKENIKAKIEQISGVIANDVLLYERWKTFLKERGTYYLNTFNPINIIQNKYVKTGMIRFGLNRPFMRKKHYAQILNHIRCESHVEAVKNALEDFLDKTKV